MLLARRRLIKKEYCMAINEMVRLAGIVKESIVDGPGIRYVVFAQGCRHNCEGCQNPETHSFDGGTFKDIDDILQDMKKNPLLDGITLSGGEPFEQAAVLAILAEEVRKLGLDVITFTGYTFEYIRDNLNEHDGWDRLLKSTDILVDGKFEMEKKSLLLKFRGSSNQRMVDVKKSLEAASVVKAEV
jgi:anaerobic ribonucleoside-triphosphate reductase activating protein